MTRRFLGAMIVFIPFISIAQGIRFDNNLSWEQVKQRAKNENKYIFVDCAASWCAPCKRMEKEVFSLKNVGDFMNANFISVHVQMDTAKNDVDNTKAWYKDAHALQQEYKIASFPSYLFFSANGKIVHRYLFALNDSLFLRIASAALDPNRQYYTLLKNYQSGKKDYTRLNYLAAISRMIDEDSLANVIANDYLHNYLNKQTDKDLLQKKYFDFINSFSLLLSSNDKMFNLLLKNGKGVDQAMNQQGFSETLVVDVITRETINPKLWPNKKAIGRPPDWSGLTNSILKKYGNKYYTDVAVLNAQLKWYHEKKDRGQEIKYTVKKIETYGLDTAGLGWVGINNLAYGLFFKYCNNKDTLNKAIRWMEIINKDRPEDYINMDTYANLLYKVGRKEEAISFQEKAMVLEEEDAKKEQRDPSPGYKERLNKMKKGLPTWM